MYYFITKIEYLFVDQKIECKNIKYPLEMVQQQKICKL